MFASRPLIDVSPPQSRTHGTKPAACLVVTPGCCDGAFIVGASSSSGVICHPAISPPLLYAATCSAPRPVSAGSGSADTETAPVLFREQFLKTRRAA